MSVIDITNYEDLVKNNFERILIIGEGNEETPTMKILNPLSQTIPDSYFDKIVDNLHFQYTFLLFYPRLKKDSRYIINNPSLGFYRSFLVDLLYIISRKKYKKYLSKERNFEEDFDCVMNVLGCTTSKIYDGEKLDKIIVNIIKTNIVGKYLEKRIKNLYTYDSEVRSKAFLRLVEILKDIRISVKLENAIRNMFDTDDIVEYPGENNYRAKMREIIQNLRVNPELAQDVADGMIGTSKLVKMSNEEMAPTYLKQIREEYEKNRLKNVMGDTCDPNTSLYKCGKCKGRNINFIQKQTRSADEGMTNILTCCDCGNRWKEYN